MIAKYMDCEYTYISNKRNKEIITSQKEKIKDGFIYENGVYYKTVDENDLTDIYTVKFFVKYKTGFDKVSDWWELGDELNVISDNQVKLVFAKGILPNWNVVDKNICSTLISLDNISKAKMVISYQKCKGVVLDKLVNKERIISLEELKRLHSSYCRVNF